jgi:hypothetical protein
LFCCSAPSGVRRPEGGALKLAGVPGRDLRRELMLQLLSAAAKQTPRRKRAQQAKVQSKEFGSTSSIRRNVVSKKLIKRCHLPRTPKQTKSSCA